MISFIKQHKKVLILGGFFIMVIPLFIAGIARVQVAESTTDVLIKSNVNLPQDVEKRQIGEGIVQAKDKKSGESYLQMEKGVKVNSNDCIISNKKRVSIVIPETKNNAFPSYEQTCKKLQADAKKAK